MKEAKKMNKVIVVGMIAACGGLLGAAAASPSVCQELKPTPPPQFADCESDITEPLKVAIKGLGRVCVEISCDARPDNALRVTLGTDANKDGALAIEEGDVRFGWDCRGWVVESIEIMARTRVAAKGEGTRRNVKFVFALNEDGACQKIEVWDEGVLVASDILEKLGGKLDCAKWNMAKTVHNGVPATNEKVKITYF